MEPVNMTAREAAKYLKISYWLLLELIKKGEGPPHIKLGSKILINKESLHEWLKSKEI